MAVSVSMPELGESVTAGIVTRWLKKEGERVEADKPLLEVSTDKVDTEIPSPARLAPGRSRNSGLGESSGCLGRSCAVQGVPVGELCGPC